MQLSENNIKKLLKYFLLKNNVYTNFLQDFYTPSIRKPFKTIDELIKNSDSLFVVCDLFVLYNMNDDFKLWYVLAKKWFNLIKQLEQ